MTAYFANLEFDLQGALIRQLVDLFDSMPKANLTAKALAAIPVDAQGVYQLFVKDEMMYIGKSDNEAGLLKRLSKHAGKVSGRKNLKPRDVHFKAVRLYVFTVVDVEQQLIAHYKKGKDSISWNNSGFGSNDPGRERDTSKLKDNHFDKRYPIDIDIPIKLGDLGQELTVVDALERLKSKLPYLLRYQKRGPLSDIELKSSKIKIEKSSNTTREVLRKVAKSLGEEWQVTVLLGYIILYRETKTYPHSVEL